MCLFQFPGENRYIIDAPEVLGYLCEVTFNINLALYDKFFFK